MATIVLNTRYNYDDLHHLIYTQQQHNALCGKTIHQLNQQIKEAEARTTSHMQKLQQLRAENIEGEKRLTARKAKLMFGLNSINRSNESVLSLEALEK